MKKIFVPAILALGLFAVSCEDKLDIPQKGVTSTIEYYSSDAEAASALANMYAQYIENVCGTEGIDNPEQVILNYAADDVLAAGSGFTDHDAFRIFDEFQYDEASGTLQSAYQRYYYSIYHANLVISNFTNENRNGLAPKYTSAYTDSCVAEARVMRAYLHMMTALIWNQPPLMDRIYEGDEFPTNNKTQSEILDWVISECEAAISSGRLLKRNGPNDKNSTARMTVGFAQFIAGKAAMFNNNPEKARKHLGDLIDSHDYDLVAPNLFWTNFHVDGDGNCETIFEPNFINDPGMTGIAWARWSLPLMRDRWMVANVFNWRSKALNSTPNVSNTDGWGGGQIQEDFAQKFLAHDGNSPRRLATFLTEDEFLYQIPWPDSQYPNGTAAEMASDTLRGIKAGGMFGTGKYFKWKTMSFLNPPAILTGGAPAHADNVPQLGDNSNESNFWVARYAEALLLYAEACIGSADAAKGLAALQAVQTRSGSGKISTELTFEAVMEEKQYELWFESCRFLDLVRWSKQGKVDLAAVYNTSGIHQHVPTVHDKLSEKDAQGNRLGTVHEFYVTYDAVPGNSDFVVGKHEYLPFPRDVRVANKNLKNVLGWAYLNGAAAE